MPGPAPGQNIEMADWNGNTASISISFPGPLVGASGHTVLSLRQEPAVLAAVILHVLELAGEIKVSDSWLGIRPTAALDTVCAICATVTVHVFGARVHAWPCTPA